LETMFGRSSRYLIEAFLNSMSPCKITGFSSSSPSSHFSQYYS
jgi:hypothetical protein